MRADQIDLSSLTAEQKVALMERLWASLVQGGHPLAPPEWHEKELSNRQGEWDNRHHLAEVWSAVREELRRELA